MDIVFYTRGLKFTGDTIDKQSLGGSETALIQLARAFAKKNHRVSVYCDCSQPGVFDGVEYFDQKDFINFIKYDECDIFIASRFYDILGKVVINAKLRILWNHDILSDHVGLISGIYGMDYMYCLSKFHVKQFLSKLPEIEPIVKQTHNGIDFSLLPPDLSNIQKQHKIIFTSRPERGLYPALQYFEKHGDKTLEFHFCNYATIDDPQVKQIEKVCDEYVARLIAEGFKITRGRYTKKELYGVIASAKAVLYPTEFPEISCISAMEAQACGTVMVTTHAFALEETLAYKGIVPGEQYADRFSKRLKKVLDEEAYRKDLEQQGLEYVKKYTWENVADTFLNDAAAHFKERSQDVDGVLDQLIYESDLVAAREIAKEHAPHRVAELDHMLRFVDGKEDYKKIYENEDTFEKQEIESFYSNERFNWVASRVKELKIDTILDYACHMGHSTLVIGKENPNCKALGFDISQKAIDSARKRFEQFPEQKDNVAFLAQDEMAETKIEFTATSNYGAVFCGEFLEHISEPEAFVDKLESYVKDGGKIFLTLPRGAWEWLSKEENKRLDVVYHVNHFTKHDVLTMFQAKKDFKVNVINRGVGYCEEFLGNYVIEYTVDKKAEPTPKRKINYKRLMTRPYQSISACLIVKNGAKDIENCLDSIKNEVDEIILLDDHSTDDTIERAKKYCDKIITGKPSICAPDWDGFSNARNATIDAATKKWIFWIDSDERAIGFKFIRKFLNGTLLDAFVVKQHHAQLDNFIEADKPQRLFKRGKGKFVGYIHEQVMRTDDENSALFPSLVMEPVKVINFGSINELMRREKEISRNHPLLLKDLKENPDRKLAKIFAMREYLNQITWSAEKYGSYKNKEAVEECIPIIKEMWKKHFQNEKDVLYYEIAEKIYQEALQKTESGFEVAYAMTVNKQSIQDNHLKCDKYRIFEEDVDRFFDNLKKNLKNSIGVK